MAAAGKSYLEAALNAKKKQEDADLRAALRLSQEEAQSKEKLEKEEEQNLQRVLAQSISDAECKESTKAQETDDEHLQRACKESMKAQETYDEELQRACKESMKPQDRLTAIKAADKDADPSQHSKDWAIGVLLGTGHWPEGLPEDTALEKQPLCPILRNSQPMFVGRDGNCLFYSAAKYKMAVFGGGDSMDQQRRCDEYARREPAHEELVRKLADELRKEVLDHICIFRKEFADPLATYCEYSQKGMFLPGLAKVWCSVCMCITGFPSHHPATQHLGRC
jgi:hypothetical protein